MFNYKNPVNPTLLLATTFRRYLVLPFLKSPQYIARLLEIPSSQNDKHKD